MLKTAPGWELDVDRGPDWLLVKLYRPEEEAEEGPPLADLLWSLLEQHFSRRLVLELNAIKEFDDEVIEQLVLLHDRICAHGGLMRVCGLSPQNRRLLLQQHLADRFIPYADREDAVLGRCAPRLPR